MLWTERCLTWMMTEEGRMASFYQRANLPQYPGCLGNSEKGRPVLMRWARGEAPAMTIPRHLSIMDFGGSACLICIPIF